LAIYGANFPARTDITHMVRAKQGPAAQAAAIRPQVLQRIMQSLLEDPRGISGLNFNIEGTAVSTKDLPRFLALAKYSLAQIGNILYGIYRELKQNKTLTIGQDNQIRVSSEQLAEMAKNPAIAATLASLGRMVESARTFDPLYASTQKPAAPAGGTPPSVPYNQPDTMSQVKFVDPIKEAPTDEITPQGNDIHLPQHLLYSVLGAYGRITKDDIAAACAILFPKGEAA
jgi:hypothetical protein